MVKLQQEELQRYARHIVLSEIGGAGQQKLKSARVLVIGAGGLGSPVVQYLAAAGVGTIGVVDDDRVSLSNLQRQVLHTTSQVGNLKTDSAEDAVKSMNPHVKMERWPIRLTDQNALALVTQYHVIAEGSDNFATRYAVADACEAAEKTLVSGAVGKFDGSLTTYKPFAQTPSGEHYPGFRDIFPKPPEAGVVPSCEEAGVLGALTGVIGSIQALEVIKEITGVGETLAGRLLMYDSKAARFETIQF